MNNLINKIHSFFSPQREIDNLSKDKYGKTDLSNYNKKIKIIEQKDIPIRSQNIISGNYYKNYNPDIYICSGQLSKEEFDRITKEYNEKQEKI
jgi:hypothetical protein